MQFRIALIWIVLLIARGVCAAQERVAPINATSRRFRHRSPRTTPEMPQSTHLRITPSVLTVTSRSFPSDIDEVSNKPMRIDIKGNIHLPIPARVHPTGLIVDQLRTYPEKSLT